MTHLSAFFAGLRKPSVNGIRFYIVPSYRRAYNAGRAVRSVLIGRVSA